MRKCIIFIVIVGLMAVFWGCSRLDAPIHPVGEIVVTKSEKAEVQKQGESKTAKVEMGQSAVGELQANNEKLSPEEPSSTPPEESSSTKNSQIKEEAVQPKEATGSQVNTDRSESNRRLLNVIATAYSHNCGTGDGITATGTKVRPGVIAVDPNVIPYGTEVFIEGYGHFIAEDTGGAIKGNRIDIFMDSEEQVIQFGVQELKVWL